MLGVIRKVSSDLGDTVNNLFSKSVAKQTQESKLWQWWMPNYPNQKRLFSQHRLWQAILPVGFWNLPLLWTHFDPQILKSHLTPTAWVAKFQLLNKYISLSLSLFTTLTTGYNCRVKCCLKIILLPFYRALWAESSVN